MASIKKALDRFDLGTPMIANMLGAEYDDGNDRVGDVEPVKKRVARPQSSKKKKKNPTMLSS